MPLLALLVLLSAPPTITDQGIYSDLDAKVELGPVPWLAPTDPQLRVDAKRHLATLYYGGHPVDLMPIKHATTTLDGLGLSPQHALQLLPLTGLKITLGPAPRDRDRDGITDLIDLRMGARKVALNGAQYRGTYERLAWPNGDVDRSYGVCTDVIIRAARNAGVDLQVEILRHMRRHPKRYGLRAGQKPNPHIEHRRVRRMLPWFKATHRSLSTTFDPKATGHNTWLPGDIVFMDTLPKAGADHVGLLSDRLHSDGQPLIINNWTDGYQTQDMALMGSIPILARYRLGLRR
jgi:hypothetical protein